MEIGAALRRARPHVSAVLGLDLRSLALFRIGLGSVLLVDLLLRIPMLEALYGVRGVLSRDVLAAPGDTLFPLYLWAETPPWLWGAHGLALVSALAFTAGWRTRWATLACWWSVGSLQLGNPIVVTYGDRILHMVLFWALFLPLGARASLDARRRPGAVPGGSVLSFGSAGLVIQLAAIYLMAGLLKTGPEWHQDANAIAHVLREEYWARPSALWLLGHPDSIAFLTRATLWFERLLPLALLLPSAWVRTAAVLSIWCFHLGLAAFVELSAFPWICIAATSALLPGGLWDRLASAPATGTPGARPGQAALQAVAALALAFLLAQNAATLRGRSWLPGAVHRAAAWAELDQRWAMYAPSPGKTDGYYVLIGQLADGRAVDLHRGGADLSDTPPPLPWSHADFRYAMFLKHVRSFDAMQRRTAQWHCHDWNRAHAGPERLAAVELVFVAEARGSWRGRGALRRRSLIRLECPTPSRPPPPR